MKIKSVLVVLLCLFVASFNAEAAKIGFNPDDDIEKLRERYESFVHYLEEITGEAHEMTVSSSYEELRLQIENGEIDIAVLSPLNYVRTSQGNNVEIIARLEKYGKSHYSSILLIRNDQVTEIGNLSERTFVYFSKTSTSGYLYPMYLLNERQVRITKTKEVAGNHFNVIESVINGDGLFAATSNDKYEEAARRGIAVGELTIILRSPEEIPFDAVVLNQNMSFERRNIYKRAIGTLMTMDSSAFAEVFPAKAITKLVSAKDTDYDILRKTHARVSGGGVLRLGLSLNLEPHSIVGKETAFRPLQKYIFSKYSIYIELKIYQRDDFETILDDLRKERVDIAELPPIPAGKAIFEGYEPLLSPLFDNKTHYEMVLIRHRDRGEIVEMQQIQNMKMAVMKKTSASGFAYPMYYLSQKGVEKRDSDLTKFSEPFEVINAVAGKQVDVGAVATFMLTRAKTEGLLDLPPKK